MKSKVVLMALVLALGILGALQLPQGHAAPITFPKLSPITTSTTTYQWSLEYPWQTKLIYAQGVWWLFFADTYTGTCDGFAPDGVNACLFYSYSLNNGNTWTTTSVNEICSQVIKSITPPESLAVTTDGTYVYLACDLGTRADVGIFGDGGIGAIYTQRGLLSTSGSITWTARQRIGTAPIIFSNGYFEQEVIRLNVPTQRALVGYRLDNKNQSCIAGCSYPYLSVSNCAACNPGSTGFTTTQMSAQSCGAAGGAGIGYEIEMTVLTAGKMLVFYNGYSGDTSCRASVGIPKYRVWIEPGPIGAELTSGFTDQVDGVAFTDTNGVAQSGSLGGLGWYEFPTPVGNSNPGYCGYQDCSAVTWMVNDTVNGGASVSLLWTRATLFQYNTLDEHTSIIYDGQTKSVYVMWTDMLCIADDTPSDVFIWKAQTLDPAKGGWGNPLRWLDNANIYLENAGGSVGFACSGKQAADVGAWAGTLATFTVSDGNNAFGYVLMTNRQAPWQFNFGAWEPNQLVFPTATNELNTIGQKVLFDDTFQGGPLVSDQWTNGLQQGAKFASANPVWVSGGYLWIQPAAGTALVALNTNVISTTPFSAGFGGGGSFGSSVTYKRKLTAAMIPFATQVGPSQANVKVGFGPLMKQGTINLAIAANVVNTDTSYNCATSTFTTDNIGIMYMYMDTTGAVHAVSCGDNGSNAGYRTDTTMITALDPRLYTVFTIEYIGTSSFGGMDNQGSAASVFFMVYQEDAQSNLIGSTNTTLTLTGVFPQNGVINTVAPFENPLYGFIAVNTDSAHTSLTRVNLFQWQNFGSNVCITTGCVSPLPNQGGCTGFNAFATIANSMLGLSCWLGQGNPTLGGYVFFFLTLIGTALPTMVSTKYFPATATVGVGDIGIFLYSGYFPLWFAAGIAIGAVFLAVLALRKLLGIGEGSSLDSAPSGDVAA